jgi:rare lipoprotein A
MKSITILLFTIYFGVICIQQHTAAQPVPAPGPMVPVPGPMVPVPGPMVPVPGPMVPVPGPTIPVPGPAIPVPVPAVPGGEYFRQEGVASWYGYEFDGRPTASGEIYNSSLFTAAHPTLPFGTTLLVTNRQNNRQVAVKVNDRGPFVGGRIIDLSRAAAEQLDMLITGTAPVTIDKVPANHPLYAQQPFQPPYGYYLPQQSPQIVYPQPLPPQALPPQAFMPQPLPPQALPPQAFMPQQAPMVITQPMLPPPQRLPPLPPQQAGPMTPILIPTPPPPPPDAPPPAAAPYTPVTVQVFPSTQTTTITPNPVVDLPGGPRARLNPSITPNPDRIYKLQVGSYRIAGNAVDAYVKLKAVGLDPSYERNADYFRVVLAGIRGTNVLSVTEKLGTAGFREAVIREER